MKFLRAVIFDLYFTLLYDDDSGMRQRAAQVAAAAGVKPVDWVRAWQSTSNEGMRGTYPTMASRVRQALAAAGVESPDHRLIDELTGLLLARQVPRLYSDVRPSLEEIKWRGYRLGLISNLHQNERAWLREFELESYFDVLTYSCEVGKVKPEPEIYLMTCERLGAPPEECVHVDDVPSYLAGAQAVGITGVRINRFDSEEPYAYDGSPGVMPDHFVRNLQEFLAWLPQSAGEMSP